MVLPACRLLGAYLALTPLATADDLAGSVIANGGTSRAVGGGLELAGTVGQVVAGRSTGGGLTLDGGFWHPAGAPAGPRIFRNGFED